MHLLCEGRCFRFPTGLTWLTLGYACGTGNYTLEYHRAGLSMSGIDQSPLMIDQAKARSSDILWFIADAEKLPFDDSQFNGKYPFDCSISAIEPRDIFIIG